MNISKTEIRSIAKNVIKEHELKNIKIQFKHVHRGRARPLHRAITIPIWTLQGIKEYAIYYIVHEICHFIRIDKFHTRGHGVEFKNQETSILEKYNIKPIYSKAYPKYLTDLQGNKLCNRWGEKV